MDTTKLRELAARLDGAENLARKLSVAEDAIVLLLSAIEQSKAAGHPLEPHGPTCTHARAAIDAIRAEAASVGGGE